MRPVPAHLGLRTTTSPRMPSTRGAIRRQRRESSQCHHGRQAQRFGQDGRVRRWPALGGAEGQDFVLIQRRGLRRGKVSGNDHSGVLKLQTARWAANQVAQDTPPDVADIDSTRTEGGVGQRLELGTQRLGSVHPGCFRIEPAGDGRPSVLQQGDIIDKHLVGKKNVGFTGLGVFGQFFLQHGQLRARQIHAESRRRPSPAKSEPGKSPVEY